MLVAKYELRRPLGRLGVYARKILRLILRKQNTRVWTDFVKPRIKFFKRPPEVLLVWSMALVISPHWSLFPVPFAFYEESISPRYRFLKPKFLPTSCDIPSQWREKLINKTCHAEHETLFTLLQTVTHWSSSKKSNFHLQAYFLPTDK